jgi:tetratricopeptide (TPR) repeat protein
VNSISNNSDDATTDRFRKEWTPHPSVYRSPEEWRSQTKILSDIKGVKNPIVHKRVEQTFLYCIPEIRGIGKKMIIKYYSKAGVRNAEFIKALAVSAKNDKDFNVAYQSLVELGKMLVNNDIEEPDLHAQVIDAVSTAAIRSNSPLERELAVEILGQVGDTHAIEVLEKTEADKNYSVRVFAEYALAQLKARLFSSPAPADVEKLKTEEETDDIVKLLLDEKELVRVRLDAALALGTIHNPKATAGLIAASKDSNLAIREQAIISLDRLLDAHSIEALIHASRSNEDYLQTVKGVQPQTAVNSNQQKRRVLKESATNANNYLKSGDFFTAYGRFERALDCYDEAMNSDPNLPLVWEKRGDTLLKLGRKAEANACFCVNYKMKMIERLFL